MTSASYRMRRVGYTAEILHRERTRIVPDLLPDARDDWHAMMRAVSSGYVMRPRFTTRDGRAALRTSWRLGMSPLAQWARCHECATVADACECATDNDGVLYIYTCPYCDAACPHGEPCCDPPCDDDDAEEYSDPAPHGDGYSRGSWDGISRRDVAFKGTRTPWAPYYVGIEYETDSTPTRDEWRGLRESDAIMGAWPDCTVRGPEIVTQPCRGESLARVVARLAALHVSLTCASDRVGKQCGLHIHVDCREASPATRRAMVRVWRAVQSALWAWPESHLRHDSTYCHPLEPEHMLYWLTQGSDEPEGEEPTRYYDCNLHSLREHSTVEVRLFGWPADANTWTPRQREAYVWRCIRVVQAMRTAAKLLGDSVTHPFFDLPPVDALVMLTELVPARPGEGV